MDQLLERFKHLCWYILALADISLSQKLQEELKYEQEAIAETANVTPDFLKSFLEQGVWSVRIHISFRKQISSKRLCAKINDVRGNDEVTLTRKFGDEKSVHEA